ncbi:MAG: cobalamin-binding protein [Chloroflexi bacterium]|nr:cobalamin-binding protein [Chloroflexota bacterium]
MIRLNILRRVALVFLLLTLAACGATTTAPTTVPQPTSTPAATPTTVPQPTDTPAATPTTVPQPTSTPAAAPVVVLTDSAGREVALEALPQTFVSLAPSTTEILFALGLGQQVIAIDDFSNYPAEAESLPRIGGTDFSYNYEQIAVLQPDLVLAAGITSPEAVEKIESLGIPVAILGTPETTLDGVFADIELAGALTGRSEQARLITTAMRARLDEIKARIAPVTERPRVFWELDATDPAKPFTVGPGNFISDLLNIAGGENIFATADSPFPQVSAEQIVAADPQIILLADAQYGITVESVLARPGWETITAIKEKRVYPINDDLVSRPGPRIIEGLESIARLLHPDLFGG